MLGGLWGGFGCKSGEEASSANQTKHAKPSSNYEIASLVISRKLQTKFLSHATDQHSNFSFIRCTQTFTRNVIGSDLMGRGWMDLAVGVKSCLLAPNPTPATPKFS